MMYDYKLHLTIKNPTGLPVGAVSAHRLSTVSNADKIVLINKGNIEETGTHDELLEKSTLYKNMWEAHMSVKDKKEVEKDA